MKGCIDSLMAIIPIILFVLTQDYNDVDNNKIVIFTKVTHYDNKYIRCNNTYHILNVAASMHFTILR